MEFLNRFSIRFRALSKAENYAYTPMEQLDGQIRLVTIRPGTWSDIIACEVHVASMDDSPSYEALSYVWGDANKRRPISVDGQHFEVAENLYLALRRLRRAASPRVMWIDAICINQKDDKEKSTQVGMMGRIYSNCQKAVLWLGEDPKSLRFPRLSSPPRSLTARRAFKMLRILGQDKHINELPCFVAKKGTYDGTFLLHTGHLHFIAKRSRHDKEDPIHKGHPCFRHHFECLATLTHLPWWTRIWVVQEMVLPSRVEFAFASETCEYEVLESFFQNFSKHVGSCCKDWLQELYDKHLPAQALIGDVGALISTRQSLAKGSKFTLLELRSMFWTFEATDQRDLIYALLGVVEDWENDVQPLRPDYSLPYTKVVCEVFFSFIHHTGDLRALEGHRWSSNTGLPSWIPDMKVSILDRAEVVRVQTNDLALRSLFDASTRPLGEVELTTDSALRVQSLEFDTIKATGDRISPEDISNWDVLSSTLRQWMAAAGLQDFPPGYPPAEASMESQFWRALIHDCIYMRSPEPPYYSRATQDDYYTLRPYLSAVQRRDRTVMLPLNVWEIFSMVLVESVMFLTESGRVGMGPANCRVGDQVHVIPGSRVPYILRPKPFTSSVRECSMSDGDTFPRYTVVGDAFSHGIMDGEAIKSSKPEDIKTIDLI